MKKTNGYAPVQPYYDIFGSITSTGILFSSFRPWHFAVRLLLFFAGTMSLSLRVHRLIDLDSSRMFWCDACASILVLVIGGLYYWKAMTHFEVFMLLAPAYCMCMSWFEWQRVPSRVYHSAILHTVAHYILNMFLFTFPLNY